MKLRTLPIAAILMAAITLGRSATAGQAENHPVTTYAAPAELSLVSLYATTDRITYRTEESLFSRLDPTVRTEEGIIAVWRARVFASLAANMTPDATNGERMVERIAMKESMKMALERLPQLERLIKMLKLEVSTEMLAKEEEQDEQDEARILSMTPKGGQAVHQAVKERLFVKTGLRIPIAQGKPTLLSETTAVYGSVTSYFNVRLDGKFDSRLGVRYTLSRDMQVQVERTIADAADPASGGTVRRSASNSIKLVCVF